MVAETAVQSRLRAAGRIKSRLIEALRDDLADMARASALSQTWMTPREIGQQLDLTGYRLSTRSRLAPFLSPEQCVTMIAVALNDLTANDVREHWWRNENAIPPASNRLEPAPARRLTGSALPGRMNWRTAIYGGPEEESVIFANEDYTSSPSVRRRVAVLRDNLRAVAISELGFAISSDGGAWVMLVYPPNEGLFENVLFSMWKATASDAQ